MSSEQALLQALTVPITDERPWVVFAACRGHEADLFFPDSPADTDKAIAICNSCPVRLECLEYSLEAQERFGIWGGLTEKERKHLLRQPA